MNFNDGGAPEAIFISRTCPSCGLARREPAVRAARKAEEQDWQTLSADWRGFFRDPSFFSYDRCTDCGQLYAPTYLTNDAISRLYSSMPNNVHSGDEASNFATQSGYATEVVSCLSKAERYLELGPDTGEFARALADLIPIKMAYLAEPNRAVWQRLRHTLPAKEITIKQDIGEFDPLIEDGSLDLVVGIHVLDHLLDPVSVLRTLFRKLARGGVAAFVVHNERSFLARILGDRWPAYCLQHPQLYNPESLADILKRCGFGDITVSPTKNKFPFGYLAAHGIYALTGKRIDLSFATWPVTMRLGNNIAICCKG